MTLNQPSLFDDPESGFKKKEEPKKNEPPIMKHNCEMQGCYLQRHVLKFDVFKGIFPRGINFMDIDASVEYRYQYLEMEWKTKRELFDSNGERLAIERKTSAKRRSAALRLTYILVVGDAETMTCSEYKVLYNGKTTGWIPGDIDALKSQIARWRDFVDRKPDSKVTHPF